MDVSVLIGKQLGALWLSRQIAEQEAVKAHKHARTQPCTHARTHTHTWVHGLRP